VVELPSIFMNPAPVRIQDYFPILSRAASWRCTGLPSERGMDLWSYAASLLAIRNTEQNRGNSDFGIHK